jgi:hypothetical protein
VPSTLEISAPANMPWAMTPWKREASGVLGVDMGRVHVARDEREGLDVVGRHAALQQRLLAPPAARRRCGSR